MQSRVIAGRRIRPRRWRSCWRPRTPARGSSPPAGGNRAAPDHPRDEQGDGDPDDAGPHWRTLPRNRARSLGKSRAGRMPAMKKTKAYSRARTRSRPADWLSRSAGNPDEMPRERSAASGGMRVTCSCMPGSWNSRQTVTVSTRAAQSPTHALLPSMQPAERSTARSSGRLRADLRRDTAGCGEHLQRRQDRVAGFGESLARLRSLGRFPAHER